MEVTNLKDLVDIVRQSRERTADVFPLPSIDDCIDFAITEAAEYIDAKKRENPIYKRNNSKEHSPRKELGQCGYMIASALIQHDGRIYDPYADWNDANYGSDPCIHGVIYQLVTWTFAGATPMYYIINGMFEWKELCLFVGYDPAELLRETCAAFEAKHLPQKPVYPVLTAEEAAAQGGR